MAITTERQEFTENNELRFRGSFTIDDVLTDPTIIVAAFRHESGVEVAFTYLADSEVGRLGTGEYFADWIPTLTGSWWYGFKGTGVVRSGHELPFFIRPAKVNYAA